MSDHDRAYENLKKMGAYQSIIPPAAEESICHTAILKCDFGSEEYVLNLQESHGKYAGDSAQIHVKDGKEAKFGNCGVTGMPCKAILTDWYAGNANDFVYDKNSLKFETSVQMETGFMICTKNGGIINAKTSGQFIKKEFGATIPDEYTYLHTNGKYIGVIYLLNYGDYNWKFILENHGLGGAFGNGHAAVMLVKNDGYGDFYSFAALLRHNTIKEDGEKKGDSFAYYLDVMGGNDVEASLSTSVDKEGNPVSVRIEHFFRMKGIHSDYMVKESGNNIYGYQRSEIDPYSHGIYIPISHEQGMEMKRKADEIRENPPMYNLYASNCSMIVQQILEADGNGIEPFGPVSGDAEDEKELLKRIIDSCGTENLSSLLVGCDLKNAVRFFEEIDNIISIEYEKREIDMTIPRAVYEKGIEKANNFYISDKPWHYGTLDELKIINKFFDQKYGRY